MEKITSFLKNLIDITPGSQFKFYIPILILTGILIVSAIVFGILYEKKKKTDFAFKRLFSKVSRKLYIMGFLFLFLTTVRYENIPYFSMRLWIYIALGVLIYLVYRGIKVYRNDYQLESENLAIKAAKSADSKSKTPKYLPNKKKRK